MKRGIIFDLDGTLWDASKASYDSFGDFFEENGFEKPSYDIYTSLIGKTSDEFGKVFFPGVSENEQAELLRKISNLKNEHLKKHGAKLYRGLEKTLKRMASDYPLYIVSNSEAGYIEIFLEYYDFHKYFDGHLSYGDTKNAKYKNIKQVINDYQLDESFYVGDTELDYLAAMKAGIPFVWASYGFGNIEQNVLELKKITKLPKVTKEIFR